MNDLSYNVLELSNLFSNKKELRKIFDEMVNINDELLERQKNDDLEVIPAIIFDHERDRFQINYNTLIRAIARVYANGDKQIEDEILVTLLFVITNKKSKKYLLEESIRVTNRVFITYSIMQLFLGISYVSSSKIQTTNLKGYIPIGRDFATDMIYQVNQSFIQYKMVPTSVEGWFQNGIAQNTINELKKNSLRFNIEQKAYSQKQCNIFWAKHKDLKKTFFE